MRKLISIALASVLVGLAGLAVHAERIYGITGPGSASNSVGVNLVFFDSATPGTVTTVGPLTGVTAGQGIKSIDFRPGRTTLYAISTVATGGAAAQIYTCNISTAVCTPLGAAITLGTNASNRTEIEYDPVQNNLRVITGGAGGSTNNFRFNATTGALIAQDPTMTVDAADPNVGYTAYSMVAAAFSNNTVGAASTTLHVYDYNSDAIFRVGSVGGTPISPNTGTIFTEDVPVDFLTGNASVGMDISGSTGVLYVTHDDPTTGASMGLFTRNPTAGLGDETPIGPYPAGTFILDISVLPAATAASVELSGQVVNAEGRGVPNAKVSITGQNGELRVALTNARGQFHFNDVETGQSYTLSANARGFTFRPQVINLTDSITGLVIAPE